MLVAPSILAADPLNLERDVCRIVEAGCDWIHVDVMDAHFVPNLAFGPAVVRALKKITDRPLDVHLMMDRPGKMIDTFLEAGADILTVHAEIGEDVNEILHRIHSSGTKCGLALKPGTDTENAKFLFPMADMILTMTVEPGFGGQKLDESVLEKIKGIRAMGYKGLIEADGGINEDNLPLLASCGLDIAVMGTAVFGKRDPAVLMRRIHDGL